MTYKKIKIIAISPKESGITIEQLKQRGYEVEQKNCTKSILDGTNLEGHLDIFQNEDEGLKILIATKK